MTVSTKTKIIFYNLLWVVSILSVLAVFIYLGGAETNNALFLEMSLLVLSSVGIATGVAGAHNTSVNKRNGVKQSDLFEIF